MEVRQVIDDLHSSLEHISQEEKLLEVIAEQLLALRRAFPSQQSVFTPSDIDFLQSLSVISDHLRAFVELKEELLSASSLEEYEDIVSRLTGAKHALASLAVGKRIAKEIRALNERLPSILEQSESRRRFRLIARVADLEQAHSACKQNHPMVVREGPRGPFWGCSKYPFCTATADLTSGEKSRLAV